MEQRNQNGSAGKSRAVRTEDQILALLDEYEASGYSVKEFCEVSEINETTFYSWMRKCRPGQKEGVKGFAAIEVLPAPVYDKPALFAEVGGIRLYKEVSAEYLKSLLP